MWFEDMKKDLQKVIREVAAFTGYHLTDYRVLLLDDHLYVDNFRSDLKCYLRKKMNDHPKFCYRKKHPESANTAERKAKMQKFIRKGKVGDWKNHFGDDLLEKFNAHVKKNLEGTDIEFQFE